MINCKGSFSIARLVAVASLFLTHGSQAVAAVCVVAPPEFERAIAQNLGQSLADAYKNFQHDYEDQIRAGRSRLDTPQGIKSTATVWEDALSRSGYPEQNQRRQCAETLSQTAFFNIGLPSLGLQKDEMAGFESVPANFNTLQTLLAAAAAIADPVDASLKPETVSCPVGQESETIVRLASERLSRDLMIAYENLRKSLPNDGKHQLDPTFVKQMWDRKLEEARYPTSDYRKACVDLLSNTAMEKADLPHIGLDSEEAVTLQTVPIDLSSLRVLFRALSRIAGPSNSTVENKRGYVQGYEAAFFDHGLAHVECKDDVSQPASSRNSCRKYMSSKSAVQVYVRSAYSPPCQSDDDRYDAAYQQAYVDADEYLKLPAATVRLDSIKNRKAQTEAALKSRQEDSDKQRFNELTDRQAYLWGYELALEDNKAPQSAIDDAKRDEKQVGAIDSRWLAYPDVILSAGQGYVAALKHLGASQAKIMDSQKFYEKRVASEQNGWAIENYLMDRPICDP
jgi:hypothetical protein